MWHLAFALVVLIVATIPGIIVVDPKSPWRERLIALLIMYVCAAIIVKQCERWRADR